MDDEVYIRPFVTFDHDPIITILVTLRVSFRLFQLSFDLSQKCPINTALALAEFAP
uniref:Uncharacterized protein n=1 Tax=virus sp. ctmTa7 TaxID=2828255 RepID=A0A8S5RCU4_9VIRU|nr:MAG TPA: hypothetical protein [virus sp. ctmTa7]